MNSVFDIGEVARTTGLTPRALRFYEARGLVTPRRTMGGRRVYGPGELARLHAAIALKRAGFTLKRISELLAGREVDLARLVSSQLARIDEQAAALADSRGLLVSVQSRMERGEPIDVATICSIIRAGQTIMSSTAWKLVVDDYFDPEAQERFRATLPGGFDQEAYGAQCRALGDRIEAALPLHPLSGEAQAFVDEWFALLKPFSDVATPEMWNGVTRMYDNRPDWKAQPDAGFGHEVWTFIRTATQARLDAGGKVDGPTWAAGAG